MPLSEELDKLDRLHRQGTLTDTEFARAKARVLDGARPEAAGHGGARINALRRSLDDRWLGGVCGGLGELTGVQAWIWRVLFVLAVTCAGTGIAVYLLLWIFVPEAEGPAQPAGA
jgi:phage shock protein PspC (stress-responsive transcriptional regulator)